VLGLLLEAGGREVDCIFVLMTSIGKLEYSEERVSATTFRIEYETE